MPEPYVKSSLDADLEAALDHTVEALILLAKSNQRKFIVKREDLRTALDHIETAEDHLETILANTK